MSEIKATGVTSAWWWQLPAEGETVPDYPPTDLTPYLKDGTVRDDETPKPSPPPA